MALPKNMVTKKGLLKDKNLNHDNLTNELLFKSLILKEDISEGMGQLEKLEDEIDLMENQIEKEVKLFLLEGGPEEDKTSVLVLEQKQEKHIT